MTSRSRRVLVTGSQGFTGRYLCQALSALGYQVIGLVNGVRPAQSERAGDLTDAAVLREIVADVAPDYVVHLAAISYVGHEDISAFYANNTLGTLNLLEALAALPRTPRRILLASSANVYGNVDQQFIDERVTPRPLNHYAASKLAMEAIASVYRHQLPILITRPFNYTGPGQSSQFLIPKLVNHFAARSSRIELGNLDVERDFLDVRSVVAIYASLLECAEGSDGVVNICSGQGLTLADIIGELENMTSHRMNVEVNPRFARPTDIRRLVGCNARLRALVPAWPELPFSQTLADMLVAAPTTVRA